jgi:hypothetical protein
MVLVLVLGVVIVHGFVVAAHWTMTRELCVCSSSSFVVNEQWLVSELTSIAVIPLSISINVPDCSGVNHFRERVEESKGEKWRLGLLLLLLSYALLYSYS